MKIEDCEINVRCLIPRGRVDRRELLNHPDIDFVNGKTECVISKVYCNETCKIRYLHTLEVQNVKIKYLELVNQFEVGDEAIWYKDVNLKVNLRGYKKDGNAIIETKDGEIYSTDLNNLSPLKKPDELEVGDKFIAPNGEEVEVIARENNTVNVVYYFVKDDIYNLDLISHHNIREIIYD